MGKGEHGGHLGAVYAAARPEELAQGYDAWAESYEADMAQAGYRHPAVVLALLTRHLPKGAAPLLDAGCGTGLVGEWLGIVGYPTVDGLDLSGGMLAVAARKGAYRALHRLALGGPLPFGDGAYAGIVSAGVFTTGHVGAEALPEIARICAPGGAFVVTVKSTLWDEAFRDRARASGLNLAEATDPYVSMPGEAGTVPSLAVVFRRGEGV